MKTLKRWFLWLMTPFQYVIQKLGRQEAKITPEAVKKILSLVQAGDILLSYESGRPTSAGIKGMFKHAVMVSDLITVIEAIGDLWKRDEETGVLENHGGVREQELIKWLYQIDKVALIRPNLPEYIRKAAGKAAPKYIGTSYDYQFEFGSEKIYCSELPYLCYRPEDTNFMQDTGDEILPQEYRDRCGQDFILIYEFKGGKYA